MNWDLFMILITILVAIAVGLFGAYKIMQLLNANKNSKENKEIIDLLNRIYDPNEKKQTNKKEFDTSNE